jgi:hypothetical protein
MSDMQSMALAIAKSGLFGMKSPEQALALGLLAVSENKPFASICAEYDVIQGRPALKSQACLARFQQAGGTIQWIKRTDKECVLEGKHPAGGTLQVTWTMDRANAAGLTGKQNWKTYPCAMLSARCVAELVRALYPACLNGVYLSEEVQDFDTKPHRIEKPVIAAEPEPDVIETDVNDIIIKDERLPKAVNDAIMSKIMKPMIPTEIVMGDISEGTRLPEAPEELPNSPLTMLQSMMWSDDVPDAQVIHFLVAKKTPKVTKTTLLKDIDVRVIERLIAVWNDVKSFKPVL